MNLKILKYDKEKAKRKFVLFKFLELFGLFLFIFGFHGLGSIIYNNFPKLYTEIVGSGIASFGNLWFCGFSTFIFGTLALVMVYVVLVVIYKIFKAWFKANWRWAKILSEDEKAKKERVGEQKKLKEIRKIEKLERQRDKYRYCVGDKMVRIEKGTFGRVGDKYKVTYVNSDGSFDCYNGPDKYADIPLKNFRIVKNKLPKRPKLSSIRQKEVEEWEK